MKTYVGKYYCFMLALQPCWSKTCIQVTPEVQQHLLLHTWCILCLSCMSTDINLHPHAVCVHASQKCRLMTSMPTSYGKSAWGQESTQHCHCMPNHSSCHVTPLEPLCIIHSCKAQVKTSLQMSSYIEQGYRRYRQPSGPLMKVRACSGKLWQTPIDTMACRHTSEGQGPSVLLNKDEHSPRTSLLRTAWMTCM